MVDHRRLGLRPWHENVFDVTIDEAPGRSPRVRPVEAGGELAAGIDLSDVKPPPPRACRPGRGDLSETYPFDSKTDMSERWAYPAKRLGGLAGTEYSSRSRLGKERTRAVIAATHSSSVLLGRAPAFG